MSTRRNSSKDKDAGVVSGAARILLGCVEYAKQSIVGTAMQEQRELQERADVAAKVAADKKGQK